MTAARPADLTLKRFAIWWLRHKPLEVPAAVDSIHRVGKFTGVTLYRAAPFQVQLFIGESGAVVVPHAHPNFESLEYWVAERGVGDGGSYWTALGKHISGMPYVAMGEPHHATAGPHGTCFISIQRWRDGVRIISGHLDWIGNMMDEVQAEFLRNGVPDA